jgi:2-oxoisovalerate dehydrogenase E1 component
LEKHFLGIPDLNILALNCRVSPEKIYNQLFETIQSPTLVIENKVLYSRFLHTNDIPGFQIYFSGESYPTVKISPIGKNPDVTIICYGGILEEVEEAIKVVFEEHEIICEVICPSQVYPLNIEPMLEAVSKTRKVLFVEEGSSFAAFSSEVIAELLENGVNINKVRRISNNGFIPASYEAEKKLLPNVETIINGLKEI